MVEWSGEDVINLEELSWDKAAKTASYNQKKEWNGLEDVEKQTVI